MMKLPKATPPSHPHSHPLILFDTSQKEPRKDEIASSVIQEQTQQRERMSSALRAIFIFVFYLRAIALLSGTAVMPAK